VDHINLTFTYTFTCNHPTNITSIECHINTELESPEKWTKNFTTAEMLNTFRLANTVNSTERKASTTLFLDTIQIDELVKSIDEQIGIGKSSEYNLIIKPEIHLETNITLDAADVRTISESFAPSLTIEFGKGTPSHIAMEDLGQTKSDTITDTHHIVYPGVMNWRIASFMATGITIPLLTVTIWFYLKAKPLPSAKPIEKIMSPHKELIAETTERPPETTQAISLASLEDLAKISEALIKPILHTKEITTKGQTTHTFYIIENDTKYQYTTTAPTKTQPKTTSTSK
jgi:hypothetical protein